MKPCVQKPKDEVDRSENDEYDGHIGSSISQEYIEIHLAPYVTVVFGRSIDWSHRSRWEDYSGKKYQTVNQGASPEHSNHQGAVPAMLTGMTDIMSISVPTLSSAEENMSLAGYCCPSCPFELVVCIRAW